MKTKQHSTRLAQILVIGLVIAILSYLFHPDLGQLSVTYNGQAVADPMVRLAAIPTFLMIMSISIVLSLMLFFSIGFMMFIAALFLAFLVCFVIAPYLWPILLIILVIITLMSFSQHNQGR